MNAASQNDTSASEDATAEEVARQQAELRELINDRSIIVVLGPGGVGKTTSAAAMAVQAARLGRNVLVLTVDPARRLATSLGLGEMGNEAVEVSKKLFTKQGLKIGEGRLHAMMLDTKSTFDALIARHAPSAATHRKIISNPFYQQASTALAGSQEYMATEKLYELHATGDYDLLILDTPPTANALDFLSAADRLEDFLQSNALRVLLRGFRSASRLGFGLMRLNRWLLKGLNRFIGAEAFIELLEFIESFQEMYTGFKDRARRVRELLRSPEVAFFLVSTADQASLDEALYLYDELSRSRLPFGAFLVNRVRHPFLSPEAAASCAKELRDQSAEIPALEYYDRSHVVGLIDRLARACARYEALSHVEMRRVIETRARLGSDGKSLVALPCFEQDIHQLRALAAFGDTIVPVD